MCLQIIYLIYVHKDDLVLNNLRYLIYHKTQLNRIKPNGTLWTYLVWFTRERVNFVGQFVLCHVLYIISPICDYTLNILI